MAGCIGSRTIHFRWVFARKCTTAVCAFTTVGIHYNFSSGQSGITMWTTDNELAGRIYIQHEIILDQLIKLNNFGFHTGNKDVFHIVIND